MKEREDKEREQIESQAKNGTPEEYQGGPVQSNAAGAPTVESPESQSYVRELDYDLIPEPGRSTYFKPPKEGGPAEPPMNEEAGEDEPVAEDAEFDSERPGAEADSDDTIRHGPETGTEKEPEDSASQGLPTGSKPTKGPRAAVPAAKEERIVFDAWDNRQVKSVNQKAKDTLEKAGLELGDHSVDTVFKGSFMAVLNPRSKEFKRFRKLWKHPELMIDPRRWTEWTGGAAVRRHCLAEGIDVSALRGSHFVELYYVKDRDLILILAEEANTNQYNVRQLKQAIGDLRDGKEDLDAGKAIIKTLDQSLPLLEEPELVALCADKERLLQELSKAERKKILTLVKKRKPGLNEWKKLMETLEGILNELEAE